MHLLCSYRAGGNTVEVKLTTWCIKKRQNLIFMNARFVFQYKRRSATGICEAYNRILAALNIVGYVNQRGIELHLTSIILLKFYFTRYREFTVYDKKPFQIPSGLKSIAR